MGSGALKLPEGFLGDPCLGENSLSSSAVEPPNNLTVNPTVKESPEPAGVSEPWGGGHKPHVQEPWHLGP